MRVNLEWRMKFTIVKINILGLMSTKRRLIILRVCEIKTVQIVLWSKIALPNIYRMIILPVDELMFLLVWALDVDVWAINASNDTWNRSHGVVLVLLAICFRLRWHLDPVPHTQHQWWYGMLLTDHHRSVLPLRLKTSSCVETQSQTHLQYVC